MLNPRNVMRHQLVLCQRACHKRCVWLYPSAWGRLSWHSPYQYRVSCVLWICHPALVILALSIVASAFAFDINARGHYLCGSNHRLVDLAASIKQYRVGAGSRYRTGPHQLGRLRHISYTIPACSVLFYTGCIRIPGLGRSGKQQRTRQCRTKQNKRCYKDCFIR